MSGPAVRELFARMAGERPAALAWAEPYGDDLGRAWVECARGDWLLWLAGILEVDRRLVVLAAVDCAVFSLSLLPEGHVETLRPLVELAQAWAKGEADAESCAAAAKDVLSIYRDPPPAPRGDEGPMTGYATAAVSAAVMVPIYESPVGIASGAAAAALAAARVATPNDEGAIDAAHARCAELVRTRIPFERLVESPGFRRFAARASRSHARGEVAGGA
ncbi:MAG: hypothetical protein D6731_11755 [Planctomycetota bacterium]|nr:MAG: hypothetical protein D6731_11755 [Planctomycetota bacterium]